LTGFIGGEAGVIRASRYGRAELRHDGGEESSGAGKDAPDGA